MYVPVLIVSSSQGKKLVSDFISNVPISTKASVPLIMVNVNQILVSRKRTIGSLSLALNPVFRYRKEAIIY